MKPFRTIWLLLLPIILMVSCRKEKGLGDPPRPDPPTVNCTAAKGDAELFAIFPADNAWNKDISQSETEPYSSQIIAGFSANSIKADFGSGLWEGSPIGIPYVVVCGNQAKVTINYTDYGD